MVLAVTGGGSRAIGQLLEEPGGSQSVLEAVVPYSQSALQAWLGGPPEGACSAATARAMAMAAWSRARVLAPQIDPHRLVGLGATASLVSSRPKRGPHRIHVAVQTATQTECCSLQLVKQERQRKKEDYLATKLILLRLAQGCGLDVDAARAALDEQLLPEESIDSQQQQADAVWTELLLGERESVAILPGASGKQGDLALADCPRVLLSGSFNPPHVGHRQMSLLARARLQQPVAWELSITNVDKPPLDFLTLGQRIDQIRAVEPHRVILLTTAPTFREKARMYPDSTFVVGADTILRIGDPRYYANDPARRDADLEQIATAGCRFLVFGRQFDGQFQTLSDLPLPAALVKLCEEVSAEDFREDVSSTELRPSDSQ